MAPTICDNSAVDSSGVPELGLEGGASLEDICLTGISGSFPDSDSVQHLADNLYNKVDMISDDDRRWKKHVYPDVPHRSGVINNVEKFDAAFFGFGHKQAHAINPMWRIMLERVYEAIIDAGYNPSELRNTNTGVFIGISSEESQLKWVYDKLERNEYCTAGCARSMVPGFISQWLGLKGPSYTVDTACSSSLYALDRAVRAIRNGDCEAAIVGGANLLLHVPVTRQFYRMGVLSPDGRCKSFDDRANGYVRAETVAAVFLQKAKHSRRIYAQIVHAKTNCDGYKEEGITYPAGEAQEKLLEAFYTECNIPPHTLEYVEAHGTGTRVGDPEELNAIDRIFCAGRAGPLLIGSVKSNLGHAEASSGICSLAKLCIAYTNGYIPPNINYATPREGIPALSEGRLRVVTEKTPWDRGMAGISSFGFGGANAHVLLRNIAKAKVNNGLPSDELPRLVCVSGRTVSAVAKILKQLESKTVDVEEIRLWHAIHEQNITGHHFRGFVLLGTETKKSVLLHREIRRIPNVKKPLCFVYSGGETEWAAIGRQLLVIPAFASSIQKCQNYLEKKGLDLIKSIVDSKSNNRSNECYSTIGAVAIQIALTDVLNHINIKPDYYIGHGIGELVCAYADGCLSLEQTISAAWNVELASEPLPNTDVSDIKIVQYLAKARSERWVSSSALQVETKRSLQLSFAKYHAKRSKASVSREEYLQHLPPNTVLLEFGPQALLTEVSANDIEQISLIHHRKSLHWLLTALGRLYKKGQNPHLAKIYPSVQFPVAQGTPMLAHLVEWDHSENWSVLADNFPYASKTCESTMKFSLKVDCYEYLEEHKIDGRVIYPATGYLVLAWKTLAQIVGKHQADVSVVFEDVCLLRATNVPKDATVTFTINIHRGSGNFEISENGTPVVTGRIYEKENVAKDYRAIPTVTKGQPEDPYSKYNMSKKDFYKELNLRGYNHGGIFRGVLQCSVDGTRSLLEWENNWVTFLDSILQVRLISHDTRNLCLPTRIEKLSIDMKVHSAIINKLGFEKRKVIPYQFYPESKKARCGGVEVHETHVTAISKKNPVGIPVLEKYEFFPNFTDSTVPFADSVHLQLQLIIENVPTYKFKVIELVDREYNKNNLKPEIELVGETLANIPLIQSELLVLTHEAYLDLPSTIGVSNKKISGESNVTLFMGANILSRQNIFEQASFTLKKGGFILSREISPPSSQQNLQNYDIITTHRTDVEYLVLLRKKAQSKSTKYIEITTTDQSYSWISKIKEEMDGKNKIVLFTQNETVNGLLGLVNCLTKEAGGDVVKGLLIADPNAPKFNPDSTFYKEQLSKDLTINVYKNGQWGTYRHLLLKEVNAVPASHAYVNTATMGDLTSLHWWQGSITNDQLIEEGKSRVYVYSSAVNFRDVMTALGRVTVDAVARGRLAQQCVQGIEVAGRNHRGARVMTICNNGISNIVEIDDTLELPFPEEWSFEEAATVPIAYYTAYLALVLIGKVRRGESILVHCGSGGAGQAAISVALHQGLQVFTTAGTPHKRALIKKLFPQLKDSHIGNSRDTSFEHMIRRETNGEGVDVVLNSLSDEKLQASARCLRRRGRFLEMGKYDIMANTQLQMCVFKKDVSFHGVMLDYTCDESIAHRLKLRQLLIDGIASGAVRPLTHCTFGTHEVEAAYRYMAAGKHIGKVIIKIREEEQGDRNIHPSPSIINAIPRYLCNKNGVYVLVGGLGGFGLELADWLVLRGARRLLLCSRRGLSSGYQAYRLRIWASYGADVKISTHDVTTEQGCAEMLNMANAMGPVRAIFNLAVVLNDAIFTNQTAETFRNSFGPKAATTINLDKLTRKMCPDLTDFVVFSSVSCGRGNAGQTNYGYSNSVMERVCEERHCQGLPALAIQWGAVGDVGLVADMQEENQQLEIGGTLQQRIPSCLLTLDQLLTQRAPLVSSMVVAEKRLSGHGSGNIVNAVAAIMGIPDLKTVSQQVALSELGMDSIMAVEIKQTLEREFEIFLDAQQIRKLTFSKLLELSAEVNAGLDKGTGAGSSAEVTPAAPAMLGLLLRNLGDEATANEPCIVLPSLATTKLKDNTYDQTMFLMAGVEGAASALQPLCRKLAARTCVLQLGVTDPRQDMQAITHQMYKIVKQRLTPNSPFYLLGYSYGTLPILSLAAKLESEGLKGIVFCVDGSPDFVHSLAKHKLNNTNDYTLQNGLIINFMKVFSKTDLQPHQILSKFDPNQTLEERASIAYDLSPPAVTYSKDFLIKLCIALIARCKHMLYFKDNKIRKLRSPIVLLRVKDNLPYTPCDEHYGLNMYTDGGVTTHFIEADHVSIIDDDTCADKINKCLSMTKAATVDSSVGKKHRIGT